MISNIKTVHRPPVVTNEKYRSEFEDVEPEIWHFFMRESKNGSKWQKIAKNGILAHICQRKKVICLS